MENIKGFKKTKLSFLRKAVIASATITKQKNSFHNFTVIDISIPRKLLYAYKSKTGKSLSFTGYITKCFANAISKHSNLNSFISGNSIVYIKETIISVLIERIINDEFVPEPLVINNCDSKNLIDIHSEIREAQNRKSQDNHLGELLNNFWLKFIPSFLLKTFVKIADRNIKMGIKYGKLAVTAVGMHVMNPIWLIPHGSATVLISIGSIINRVVINDGKIENREHLCLTVSFDHDLVDGAPAARFMSDLIDEIKNASSIIEIFEI